MYLMGIDPTEVSDAAKAALGTIAFNTTSAGIKGYMYVRDSGSGVTGDGYVVAISGSAFTAVMLTTVLAAPGTGTGKAVGVARAAVTANYYFWVQVYGPGVVRNAASTVAYTQLNTIATAGQLDDDATAGARVIVGIVLDVTTGGAAATTAAWIQWPRVDRTL